MTPLNKYSPAELADYMKKEGKIFYNVAYYLYVDGNLYTVFLMIPFKGMERFVFHAVDTGLISRDDDIDYGALDEDEFEDVMRKFCNNNTIQKFKHDTVYLRSTLIYNVDLRQFVEDCFTDLAKKLNVVEFEAYPQGLFDTECKKSFNESRYRQ